MHTAANHQWCAITNKIDRKVLRNYHSRMKEPMINMKLLVVAVYAYTPISEQSWLKFTKVKEPTYETVSLHKMPNIIQGTHINIEEQITALATMVWKSVREFQDHMRKYIAEVTKHVKWAAQATQDYGFVRKPELRHQYGMLINHHGQVISGLKNMDLFLSIDLPKVEDIQHVPPPFPDCDDWAAPHRTNRNQHVYYSALGFGKDNHGPMTELNTNTSAYLVEAIHITVCNQYKNKYTKLFDRIATIKQNITYKIEKVMPRLMPNKNTIIYGKETESTNKTQMGNPFGINIYRGQYYWRSDNERC